VKTNYVLVDFENVQPESLDALNHEPFKVIVFVGASQTRIAFDTVASIHRMAARAQYVQISGNGKNALDFHIAYYMGRIAAAEPDACFHVVSKDTGFDPLIQHLRSKGVHCRRAENVVAVTAMPSTATPGLGVQPHPAAPPDRPAASIPAKSPCPTSPPVRSRSVSPTPSAASPSHIRKPPAAAQPSAVAQTSTAPALPIPHRIQAVPKTAPAPKKKPVQQAKPAPIPSQTAKQFIDHLAGRKKGRPETLKALKTEIIKFFHQTSVPTGGSRGVIQAATEAGVIAVVNEKVTYPGT
jgi:hypothetical protein